MSNTAEPDNPAASVEDIMRDAPQTIAVFLRHRMRCVGCPIGRFHELKDVCHIYGLDLLMFATEIAAAARCFEDASLVRDGISKQHQTMRVAENDTLPPA